MVQGLFPPVGPPSLSPGLVRLARYRHHNGQGGDDDDDDDDGLVLDLR